MKIDKICANLQAMLDDNMCHDEMTGSQVIAVNEAMQALCEKAAREHPQPLTLDELRQMDGQPVWVVSDSSSGHWLIVDCVNDGLSGAGWFCSCEAVADKRATAYRYQPKEPTP